jgi:hypothetical protein
MAASASEPPRRSEMFYRQTFILEKSEVARNGERQVDELGLAANRHFNRGLVGGFEHAEENSHNLEPGR